MGGGGPWGGGPHFLRRITRSHSPYVERLPALERCTDLRRGTHRPGERAPEDPGYGAGRELLTSKQQLPSPQVRLSGREVAGHSVDTHASALQPVRGRLTMRRHLERSYPKRRRHLKQYPAAQSLPAAVRAARAPGQLQCEGAHASRAHGAGLGAPRGQRGRAARPPHSPRASRVSALVLAVAGTPALSPSSENLYRRRGAQQTSWSSASAPP